MCIVRELKLFLQLTKLFGFTPYSLEKIELPIQKYAVAYSLFCAGFYGFVIYQRSIEVSLGDVDKLFVLMIIRTILANVALWNDILFGIFYRTKLVIAFQKIWRYDLETRTALDKRVVRYSWTVIFFIFFNDVCISFLTYFSETQKPGLVVVLYNMIYVPMSFSIFKFTLIVYAIQRRLQRLNKMVSAGMPTKNFVNFYLLYIFAIGILFFLTGMRSVIAEINIGCPRVSMKDVRWLHSCLISAIKDVNSLYQLPLFLWIVTLTFNITSRIYSIGQNSASLLLILRECNMILFCTVLLITVITICHVTACEANKTGCIMFSPQLKFVQNRTSTSGEVNEGISVGQYFLFHPIHFSAAAGIITIDLPLLLSIAGAMTTYLVILRVPNVG
ncbi:Gustatory receptor 15 [Cephus cinctus]|nr:Gustatory receptor 15 [Cephus cinctus]